MKEKTQQYAFVRIYKTTNEKLNKVSKNMRRKKIVLIDIMADQELHKLSTVAS